MKVALLTSNNRLKTEIETVVLLLDHGLDTLHLKKRKFSKRKHKKYIRLIPKKYRKRVVIHRYHWLAVRYKLQGIHLGRRDRKKPVKTNLKIFLMRLFHPKLVVTASFHSLQSAYTTERKYHHVMMSPIFDSISKKNYSPAFSEKQLRELNEKSEHNIYALGGIDKDHVPLARADGFKGVVLYGAIWQAKEERLKVFREIVKAAKEGGPARMVHQSG